MSKYEEALNELRNISASARQNDLYDKLQELVDKETPVEPRNGDYLQACKKCNWIISSSPTTRGNYCAGCGQKLDWNIE